MSSSTSSGCTRTSSSCTGRLRHKCTWQRPLYSAECVEGEFSEVRAPERCRRSHEVRIFSAKQLPTSHQLSKKRESIVFCYETVYMLHLWVNEERRNEEP